MLATVDSDDDLRTDKQAAFVREYVKDFNASAAARRAGYSEATAGVIGWENLQKPEIQAAIQRRMEAVAALADVDAAAVVRELYDCATANASEIAAVHRDACRYCHGIEHRRQYTQGEYREALEAALAEGKLAPPLEGGTGFNATREPHPECPECFGRGVETVLIADTRKLSPKALKLYAGAQKTKDGIKAMARNQQEAVLALGRYVGIFKDRQEISGPGGGPVPLLGMTAADLSEAELAQIVADGIAQTAPTPTVGSALMSATLTHYK